MQQIPRPTIAENQGAQGAEGVAGAESLGVGLLRVEGLKTYFPGPRTSGLPWGTRATVKAVDGVDFAIPRGRTLGLVGESGSGKSTVARSVLRLTTVTAGRVVFDGQDLARLGVRPLRRLRQRMQMIFQDPYASLDPRQTVGYTVGEGLLIHKRVSSRHELRDRVDQLLEMVGLNGELANRYPHEFSGGQRQRVGIACALATEPDFIVADEPISALDVSIQAQIINLLRDLQTRLGLTYLFISHDLRAVRYLSDDVAVMYLGKLVEVAPNASVFARPLHPYTQGLLRSAPVARWKRPETALPVVGGEMPNPMNPPPGCHFSTRCPHAMAVCRQSEPPLAPAASDPRHKVACFLVNPA